MVVFRCECEEVLAVEENSGDRLGECPSCGVIVRVPATAMNLKGRLRRKAAASQAMRSVPAAPSIPPIPAAVAEAEPMEAEPVDAVEAEPIEAPAEVQEAAFDAEIADLRANTVPAEGHAVEEGFAKHSEDEVSTAQEVEPTDVVEAPQEVAEAMEVEAVEAAPDVVPETVADNSGYAEAPAEAEAIAEAPVVEDAPAETVEEAPMETVPEKKKLSKRERLKLKKKNRGFEDAPVAEEAAPVEAPVAEVVEEPAAPVEEIPAQEEPVAVTTEEAAAPVEEAPAEKSRSGLKSGIKKPMGLKGKTAIGSAVGSASSARKGVSVRPKKEAAADGDAPKKGKSMLFIIGALVLAGAIGAGVYVMREQPAEPGKNGGGDTKKEAPEDKKGDETPKTDAPADPAKAETPEAPKTDAPKSDAPEAPKTDAPKEEPKADAPKAEAPKGGALPKDAPTAPAE